MRLLIFFAAFLVAGGLFGQEKTKKSSKEGYSFKVKVKGLAVNDTCLLAYYYGDKKYIQDTAVVDKNLTLHFDGTKNIPRGNYLVVLPNRVFFDVIMQEHPFSMETDSSDFVHHMKIKDSKENQLFYDYLRLIRDKGKEVDSLHKEFEKVKENKGDTKPLENKISGIDSTVKKYINDLIKNNPGTFVSTMLKAYQPPVVPKNPNPSDSTFGYRYYKSHFFDNMDLTKSDLLYSPVLQEKLKYYFDNLTPKSPDSIIVSADTVMRRMSRNKDLFKYTLTWITHTHEIAQWAAADEVFVHMVNRYYKKADIYWMDSTQLKKLFEFSAIKEPLLRGKVAPQMFLQDTTATPGTGNTNGKKFYPLYDVKAKYTVIIFFDPDCGHCQKEVPKLYKEVYQKYRNKGLQVYAVNATHGHYDSWKKFIKENHFDWINVHDTGPYYDFSKTYDVNSYPVIYLLDEQKKILIKKIGVESLLEYIDFLEKEKK